MLICFYLISADSDPDHSGTSDPFGEICGVDSGFLFFLGPLLSPLDVTSVFLVVSVFGGLPLFVPYRLLLFWSVH